MKFDITYIQRGSAVLAKTLSEGGDSWEIYLSPEQQALTPADLDAAISVAAQAQVKAAPVKVTPTTIRTAAGVDAIASKASIDAKAVASAIAKVIASAPTTQAGSVLET